MYSNGRPTLIDVSDIKRIRACKIDIYDPIKKQVIGEDIALVVTAVARSDESDETVSYYRLEDPIEEIAKIIGRPVEDLSSMLLQLEAGE